MWNWKQQPSQGKIKIRQKEARKRQREHKAAQFALRPAVAPRTLFDLVRIASMVGAANCASSALLF